MLISLEQISEVLKANDIHVTGALHIGAHECEELSFYNEIGISSESVIWIEAISSKVIEAKNKGIPNVYNAVITDKDDEDITFNVSNNIQSSSIFEFGTHAVEHPWVVYTEKIQAKSVTINSFFKRNNLTNCEKYNLWNFDIQGAELVALRGATEYIKYAKAIYLEVNDKELYKNCGLIGEIDDFLSKYNFKRVLTAMTQHGWGDALYILSNT